MSGQMEAQGWESAQTCALNAVLDPNRIGPFPDARAKRGGPQDVPISFGRRDLPAIDRAVLADAVYEAGAASMAVALDVNLVGVTLGLTETGTKFSGRVGPPPVEAVGLICVAGVAAMRVLGRPCASAATNDRERFDEYLPHSLFHRYRQAAESLFLSPSGMHLLQSVAGFLVARHGVKTGKPFIEGGDVIRHVMESRALAPHDEGFRWS